jgi:hypothetical protein
LCPACRGSKVDFPGWEKRLVHVRKLVLWAEWVQPGENFKQVLVAHRFDDKPVPITIDVHPIPRHLKVSGNADGLALVVSEELGLTRL